MKNQTLSEFTVDNSRRSLYHMVTSLGKFIKKGKARYFEKCQIIATKGKIMIRVAGSEFYVDAYPTREVIIDVYYTDFKIALEEDRTKDLVFKVQEITLVINNRKIPCKVKKLSKKEFDLEAGLGSLNFGEVDPEIPSWHKEIYKLKSTSQNIHIDMIKRDAEKASLLLQKYKIDPDKILRLIIDNMS